MTVATIIRKQINTFTHYLTQRRLYEDPRLHDPHVLNDIGLRWEQGQLVSIHGVEEASQLNQRHQIETRDAYETCPHCGSSLA